MAEGFPQSQDYINSLYHLGLLSHWRKDTVRAEGYYNKILDRAKGVEPKPEIAMLSEYRLTEIRDGRDIEYNLKTFLDTVFAATKEKKYIELGLYAKSPKAHKGGSVKYQTNAYVLATGCLQQDFSYLWSGLLGDNQAPFNQSEFDTSYTDLLGTKVVNVVLVGPSGAIAGTVEMAEIYPLEANNGE